MAKVTISLIKADVGGFPGHATVHPHLCDKAEEMLGEAVHSGLITNIKVIGVGTTVNFLQGTLKVKITQKSMSSRGTSSLLAPTLLKH